MKSEQQAEADVRVTMSFYAADLRAVSELRRRLRERDEALRLDRARALRGLLHATPQVDLLAYAVIQYREDAAKPGPREAELVEERFTVVLHGADLKKLDEVVDDLDAQGIRMNRSYVVRGLLRSMPPVEVLAPAFKRYLAAFPDGRTLRHRRPKTSPGKRK